MKTKHLYVILFLFLHTGCKQETVKTIYPKEKKVFEQKSDSTVFDEEKNYRDSLRNAKVDTSTIQGKIQFMKNLVNSELLLTNIEHDTMFDFNYDGHDDVFFRYYGASGSYMKYNTQVCIYNPKGNYFYTNEDLRYPNASFFIDQKKITSFYGGQVREYHWENDSWNLFLKADYDEEKEEWFIEYSGTGKTRTIKGKGVDDPSEVIDVDVFYK